MKKNKIKIFVGLFLVLFIFVGCTNTGTETSNGDNQDNSGVTDGSGSVPATANDGTIEDEFEEMYKDDFEDEVEIGELIE